MTGSTSQWTWLERICPRKMAFVTTLHRKRNRVGRRLVGGQPHLRQPELIVDLLPDHPPSRFEGAKRWAMLAPLLRSAKPLALIDARDEQPTHGGTATELPLDEVRASHRLSFHSRHRL